MLVRRKQSVKTCKVRGSLPSSESEEILVLSEHARDQHQLLQLENATALG